jgi:predicted HicB family RNase H-like nuclease
MARRKARNRPLKEKLSLTISPAVRRQAETLARQQHRSISSLVESLIAQEHERTQPAKSLS